MEAFYVIRDKCKKGPDILPNPFHNLGFYNTILALPNSEHLGPT